METEKHTYSRFWKLLQCKIICSLQYTHTKFFCLDSVRGVVAGSYLTIIKTYSEEPGYLGHYDGQDTLGHDAPQQACGLVNDRDALAHGWFEETWGAVHLGCQAGDNERE